MGMGVATPPVVAGRNERERAAALLRAALPGVFAVAALAGIIITVYWLAVTPAVDTGVFRSESHDGLALYYGLGLFHNPASGGYAGLLYTPLQPALIALLDEIGIWNGWPVILTIAGVGAIALVTAGLAYRAAGGSEAPRPMRGALAFGSLGLGGIAIFLVCSIGGVLYLSWSDGLVWGFAICGLVAGALARRPNGAAVSIALMTLAFWTKQTAIVPAAVFCAWLLVLAYRGARTWRFAIGTIGALLVVNLLVLGVLNLLTGGWELYFNFTLATRQARIYGLHQFVLDVRHDLLLPGIWCLAMCVFALGRDWRSRIRLDSPATLLLLFAVIGLPFAMYFRSKQGGGVNQYFGVVWALAALAAIAWGSSRRSHADGGRWRALACDGLVALAAIAAAVSTIQHSGRFDVSILRIEYKNSVPADLRAYARRGPLFDPYYTDLTPGAVYTDLFEAADLLAADAQPMQLVDALTARRFKYVVTYNTALGGNITTFDQYASAYGRYEAGYFWKLDRVMAAGYASVPGLPSGILERRPGINRAAALAACFGPFHLAGATFEIRAGGGFWCRGAGQSISLNDAPSSLSQLVTTTPVQTSGRIVASGRPGAAISISIGGRSLTTTLGATGSHVFTVDGSGTLSIVASAGHGVRLELSDLHLRT